MLCKIDTATNTMKTLEAGHHSAHKRQLASVSSEEPTPYGPVQRPVLSKSKKRNQRRQHNDKCRQPTGKMHQMSPCSMKTVNPAGNRRAAGHTSSSVGVNEKSFQKKKTTTIRTNRSPAQVLQAAKKSVSCSRAAGNALPSVLRQRRNSEPHLGFRDPVVPSHRQASGRR